MSVDPEDVPELTRWAECWKITRKDGQVFAFTSHDQPVTVDAVEYQPCDSLAASAGELAAVLGSSGNQELVGLIADESISEQDLYAGLFDRAAIEVWMVPWKNSGGEEPFQFGGGIAGNLRQGEVVFTMEVFTAGALLQQQPLLPTFTPACRWELGDARCTVDLDALEVQGTVTAQGPVNAANRGRRRIFTDSSRAEDDGYFDEGRLVWTSGDNAGQRSEIKSFTGGQFVLWHPMIHEIQDGDAYEAVPGCDKRESTCKSKFDNFENYGGFPDVPGRDSILQTPNAH